MTETKTINKNDKTYVVQHDSYFAEVATCVESGVIYTREAYYQWYGYDNGLIGKERYTYLSNVNNPNDWIRIEKSLLIK